MVQFVLPWTNHADDVAARDSFSFRYVLERNEIDCVGSWNVANALSKTSNCFGKALHPDILILVQFYEMPKFEELACFFVKYSGCKVLCGKVGLHCACLLIHLECVVGSCKAPSVLLCGLENVDARDQIGIDLCIDQVGSFA